MYHAEIMKEKVNPEPNVICEDVTKLGPGDWEKLRNGVDPVTGRRTLRLGGSDTGAITNTSPFKTAQELYWDKIGEKPAADISGEALKAKQDIFTSGHLFEPYAADMFCYYMEQKMGKKVKLFIDNHMYQCGKRDETGDLKYPFAIADIDRVIEIDGERYILELKTTSYKNTETIKHWEEGICPPYYESQVRHYMAVTNIHKAVICCVWGLKLDCMAVVWIDWDAEAEQILLDEEEKFMMHVDMGMEPDPTGANQSLLLDWYSRKYGLPAEEEKLPAVTLTEAYGDKAKRILELQKRIAELEKEKKELEAECDRACNELLPAFVAEDGKQIAGYASYDDIDEMKRVGVALKQSMKKPAIDTARLLAEHPELVGEVGSYTVGVTEMKNFDKKHRTSYALTYKKAPEISETPKLNFKVTVKDMFILKTPLPEESSSVAH